MWRAEGRRAWLSALQEPGGSISTAAAAAAAAVAPQLGLPASALTAAVPLAGDEIDCWACFLHRVGVELRAALVHLPGVAPPFPPRLCANDGGFSRQTFLERIPAILEETLASNPSAPPAFAAAVRAELVAPLRAGALLSLPPPPVEGVEDVNVEGEPAWGDKAFSQANPFTVSSFWWQENAVYRHLMHLWLLHGGAHSDPFALQKEQALAAAAEPFRATVAPLLGDGPPDGETIHALLMRSLWGNRADLSLSAGKVVAVEGAAAGAELLSDDVAAAVQVLLAREPGRVPLVGIVLDNCGLELLSDLALVDALLRGGAHVALHAKRWPTFVSDATPYDVERHVAATGELGRLTAALRAGTLTVASHAFYNSPAAFWEMPRALRDEMRAWNLAIVKGDANYRRILGCRHWPHDLPFQVLVGGFVPCPLLALRTCKAGLVVGVAPEREREAAGRRPGDWLTCGVFGVAQLAVPTRISNGTADDAGQSLGAVDFSIDFLKPYIAPPPAEALARAEAAANHPPLPR
jgi:uncharacterized protein with ATP-grasp and redox domains